MLAIEGRIREDEEVFLGFFLMEVIEMQLPNETRNFTKTKM